MSYSQERADLMSENKALTTERDQLRAALGQIFKYLDGLSREDPIKPQKHLDMWPWKEAREALKGTPATEYSKLREALRVAHELLAEFQRTIDDDHFYKERVNEVVGLAGAALKGTL